MEDLRGLLPEAADSEGADEVPARSWLVRGSSVEGHDLVPVWLQRGTVSLAASRLRRVEPPIDADELAQIVADDYSHLPYAAREAKQAEIEAFVLRMRPGDTVLMTSQGKTYVGAITGPADYTGSSDGRSNLRRTVAWANPTRPVPFARLPQPLPAKLHSQSDVVDLTSDVAAVDELLAALNAGAPVPSRELVFPAAGPELAAEVLMDRRGCSSSPTCSASVDR